MEYHIDHKYSSSESSIDHRDTREIEYEISKHKYKKVDDYGTYIEKSKLFEIATMNVNPNHGEVGHS